MEKRNIQVIYKCFTGAVEKDELEDYLKEERDRVEKSLNHDEDDRFYYNVTIIPTMNQYNTIETLPYLYDRD